VSFLLTRYRTAIFAEEIGQQTTSGAAARLWFPTRRATERVIPLHPTFDVLADLALVPASGVSMIELRQFSRTGELPIPDWAVQLGRFCHPEPCCHVERSRDISSYEFFAFKSVSRCAFL